MIKTRQKPGFVGAKPRTKSRTASGVHDLAAMAQGYRPMWAVVGANALAEFPVLDGVEALTVIGGDARAVEEVSMRWCDAGREVVCAAPRPP
jgi:hypothetical protein